MFYITHAYAVAVPTYSRYTANTQWCQVLKQNFCPSPLLTSTSQGRSFPTCRGIGASSLGAERQREEGGLRVTVQPVPCLRASCQEKPHRRLESGWHWAAFFSFAPSYVSLPRLVPFSVPCFAFSGVRLSLGKGGENDQVPGELEFSLPSLSALFHFSLRGTRFFLFLAKKKELQQMFKTI